MPVESVLGRYAFAVAVYGGCPPPIPDGPGEVRPGLSNGGNCAVTAGGLDVLVDAEIARTETACQPDLFPGSVIRGARGDGSATGRVLLWGELRKSIVGHSGAPCSGFGRQR